MENNLKYKYPTELSDFSRTLDEKVNAYFKERNISKNANFHTACKGILWFSLLIISYAIIMSDRLSSYWLIVAFVAHGFAQLFMTYNISHDANHGAYSANPKINLSLSYTFDLVGINSYIWRLLHNTSHHSFINVKGKDSAITSNSLLRFSPHEKFSPLHKYQYLYAPIAYTLSTLYWVLTKDFYCFFSKKTYGNKVIEKHETKELIILILTKLFYYTYMLLLPIMFLSEAWYVIVLGFLIMHAFIGFHIALIFQPCHINDDSAYPQADKSGHLSNDFVSHVFSTTCDYSRKKTFTTWMLGGLNLHIIHHMYPNICHIHYPALTEILIETAEEFGYKYREHKDVKVAFTAHLSSLKTLGNA
ncbi:MAG: fatty acid desaturase [Methylobacter sp.]